MCNVMHSRTNLLFIQAQVVIHFHAQWSDPCKHMDKVLAALAGECKGPVAFKRVEAEEIDDVTAHFDITSVRGYTSERSDLKGSGQGQESSPEPGMTLPTGANLRFSQRWQGG